MTMASRPRWIVQKVKREKALREVTRWAAQVVYDEATPSVAAVDREASWARLMAQAAHCKALGCTREQIEQALDAGGLVDQRREEAKAAYLAEVSAGLPEDLARMITGGCDGHKRPHD
jgi:hypothetical protein